MTFILENRNVSYSYRDGTKALKRGEYISGGRQENSALMGLNGTGKSTLMLMFNGILRSVSGEVYFRSQVLNMTHSL